MSGIDPETTRSLFELYRAGAFAKLAERTRSLLGDHPREPVLHTLQGAACLELGEADAAIASYQQALALRPGFAKAHNSLGIACLRSGRVAEAADSFRRAIDNDARFAEPRFNLGIVHENGRRLQRAAEQYERAVALEPGYAKAWSALARVRWELGEVEGVAEHYRRALAIDDRNLSAHRGLLQFLEQSNRSEEFLDALSQARVALGADHPLVRMHEGLAAAMQDDDRTARERLEGCEFDTADQDGLHDERIRLAHLAGICDRLGDTRGAMEYAGDANRLSARLGARKGIDKQRFLDFIDHRKRYFRRENIEHWRREPAAEESEHPSGGDNRQSPAVSGDAPQPVFIVGFPRSGTTLIDTMLRGHPQIEVAEESDAAAAMIDRLSGEADDTLPALGALSGQAIRNAGAEYFERLARHVGPATATATVVDRFGLNMIYAGEILRVFPDVRFILMLRHPADCVLSAYLRTFTETSANASFHSLEEAAFLYDEVFGLWEQIAELLAPRVLEVRYEDLVENAEGACRAVVDFIGLPWHPAVLDYQRTARERPYIRTASYNQVIQPLYSGASGRWRRYRDFIEPVLPTLEPWIDRFGYTQ